MTARLARTGSLGARSLAVAAAVWVAVAVCARPAAAKCGDPVTDKSIANQTFAGATLMPVGPHPILRRTLLAYGGTVEAVASEDLGRVTGGATTLLGDVQNTPNPVQLDSGKYAVFVVTNNATVARIDVDPTTGTVAPPKVGGWSSPIALGRPGCSGDTLTATPVIHLNRYASPAFQATYPGVDLVYVATHFVKGGVCLSGHNTDNKIVALNAATGAIVWTFNATEAVDVDIISEAPFLDVANDRLVVGSERTAAPLQDTLWSIDVTTGTAAWSAAVGGVETTPVVRGETIYVGTMQGELKALNRVDGSVKWSETIVSPGAITTNVFAEFRAPYADLIGVVDLGGAVTLVRDDDHAGTVLWSTKLPRPATSRPALDPLNGKLYVGADDGLLYQLTLADGSVEASRTVDSKSGIRVVGDASYAFEDTDLDGTFDEMRLIAGSAGGYLKKFCTPWAVPLSPVAPMPDEPSEKYAPPPAGMCVSDLDCGSGPTKCADWICDAGVCVTAPKTDGEPCDDGNSNTVGDSCKSGTCAGLSRCQTDFSACQCIDRNGKLITRELLTYEVTLGERDVEVATARASNACLPLLARPPVTAIWVHMFDRDRRPFAKVTVTMEITDSGGGGSFPTWIDPKTGDPVSGTRIDTSDFVVSAPRSGTYYALLQGPGKGPATPAGEPFVIRVDGYLNSGGVTCIDTVKLGETIATDVRTAKLVSYAEGGCGAFGDVDETGTLWLEVYDSLGPLEAAPVQVGWWKEEFAFYSNFADVVSPLHPGPDLSNITTTDSKGIAIFTDMGNQLNGANQFKKALPPANVLATCPGGSIGDADTQAFVVDSAYSRLVMTCP